MKTKKKTEPLYLIATGNNNYIQIYTKDHLLKVLGDDLYEEVETWEDTFDPDAGLHGIDTDSGLCLKIESFKVIKPKIKKTLKVDIE